MTHLLFRAANFFLQARYLAATFLLLSLAILFSPPARSQTDITLNPTGSYVDVQRGIAWGAPFNRTYVLTPQTPQTSLCLYVVNNNPTNSHSFSLSMFQTADPRVPDYSNNQGRYAPVTVVGSPSPIAANSMGSAFGQTSAAAKVAFVLSGSSTAGGSPDTADIFVVQTTSGFCGAAAGATPVQGPALVGATTGLGNPVLIGGLDNGPSPRFAQVIAHGTQGNLQFDGLAIGDGGIGVQGVYSGVTLPAGSGAGPMAVALYGVDRLGRAAPVAELAAGCSAGSSACSALYTRNAGYLFYQPGVGISSSGQAFTLWGPSNLNGVSFQSCRFDLQIGGISGTGATLDAYVQDSVDGNAWTDRVHFAQVVQGGSPILAQWAGVNATGKTGVVPVTYTDHTLAVSTVVDGPIATNGQIYFVVGGTAPSFNVTVTVTCN